MNIQSVSANFSPNYANPSGQDVSLPPEVLAQLAAQAQSQPQAQNYGLQGPGQDALLSISGAGATNQAGSAGGGSDPRALGEQLEQQVSSGDLQGALATLEQLQANRPQGGQKPPGADQIDSLEATLTQQLEDGDQEGAEETLAQIQSTMQQNRPQQSGTQNQSVDQVAGLGQPAPLSNGQFPGSKLFQGSTAPTSSQSQQLLPPFQSPTAHR